MRIAQVAPLYESVPKASYWTGPRRTGEESQQVYSEYRELLAEFVRVFGTIPQKYCLFCEATTTLGMEAHKAECPYRRASKLLGE